MYSNNGTTFHGAELFNTHAKAIRDSNFRNRQTEPRGITPALPHFDGLWEASVKSVKHHLKRCGLHANTFEEMLMCSSVKSRHVLIHALSRF